MLITASLMKSKDKVYKLIENVYEIIQNTDYPKDQLSWLMSIAWNGGIEYYQSCNNKEAIKWCEMGLALLNYCQEEIKLSNEERMKSSLEELRASEIEPEPCNDIVMEDEIPLS